MKLPKLGYNLTPSRTKALGFTIYEDNAEEHALYHKGDATEELHDDKENILQPKVLALKQSTYTHRKPLSNLSIREYPGHLSSVGMLERHPIKLQQLYEPKNYNNESRTTHKFNRLPSYITPPRNTMNRILHRTVEDDDVENLLVAKEGRRRAMSVGVNKGKLHLITKNKFKILTI